ncbi:TolC family protein [Nitratifractor sp.]
MKNVWLGLLIVSTLLPSFLHGEAYTLESLIGFAMKHSTSIKKSEAQVELAKARRRESKAARLGSIDLVASYTHYNLPRTLAPLTPASIMTDPASVPTTTNLFGTGVGYSVPLFTGFAQTRQVEMDAIAAELSKSKLALTREQLAYNVASLYLSILALQDMLKAQIRHVEALKKLTEVIRKEVTLGKKAQIDLLKAEKDLYSNLAYEEVLRGNIAMTKAALASLVGLERIGEIRPVRVLVQRPRYSIEELLRGADSLNRIRIAELNVKKAEKGVQKSLSSRYPQISLNAYYGYNYGVNDGSNLYSGEFNSQKNWQIGLNAKWTIFDFGKRDATTQQARIVRMEAAVDKEQTLRDLRKSLVDAYEKMKQAYAEYRSNLKQHALAKESEAIEYVRYQSGVSTINDLLYAKSQTHLAKARLIESKYNYQKERFYMDYLLERGVK